MPRIVRPLPPSTLSRGSPWHPCCRETLSRTFLLYHVTSCYLPPVNRSQLIFTLNVAFSRISATPSSFSPRLRPVSATRPSTTRHPPPQAWSAGRSPCTSWYGGAPCRTWGCLTVVSSTWTNGLGSTLSLTTIPFPGPAVAPGLWGPPVVFSLTAMASLVLLSGAARGDSHRCLVSGFAEILDQVMIPELALLRITVEIRAISLRHRTEPAYALQPAGFAPWKRRLNSSSFGLGQHGVQFPPRWRGVSSRSLLATALTDLSLTTRQFIGSLDGGGAPSLANRLGDPGKLEH